MRLALSDVVTGEELRDQIDRLTVVMSRIVERLDVMEARADEGGRDRRAVTRVQPRWATPVNSWSRTP